METIKLYNIQERIGKAKYVINYHDGISVHKDNSPFFGIKIFKNKRDLNKCEQEFLNKGYKYK